MGEGWLGELEPDEREVWDEFVNHFRKEALGKIADSDMFFSICPENDWDVKYAVELGAAIMMDKPIIVMAHPGVELPAKLVAVADEVVHADIDTSEGREALKETIARISSTLRKETHE
jgi:hypothetical protein